MGFVRSPLAPYMPASDTGASPPRLIVLDDDPFMAELVAAIAASCGYDATAVTAFDEFRRRYDDSVRVVVLDLLMPDVDGVEVLRDLAARGSRAALVLISAFDPRVLKTATQLAIGHGLRVLASLSKPFTHEALVSALERIGEADQAVAGTLGERMPVAELRAALDGHQLVPYYQPKVQLQSAVPVGVEVLVRWRHPERGLLQPHAFIATAEREGLLEELTEQTVALALAQAVAWSGQGLELPLALNVSLRSLTRLNFPERLIAMTDRMGIAAERIVIEVTESWMAEDMLTAMDILSRLRLKGFALSIDDYGTGYSTMDQLRQMPFSELKLDQCFVRGAFSDPVARVIVESTVDMAHQLGLRVVAEGVETREDWDYLCSLGCDSAQGYFIAAPMDGASLPGWMAAWRLPEGGGRRIPLHSRGQS